jgi:hypothetical protein
MYKIACYQTKYRKLPTSNLSFIGKLINKINYTRDSFDFQKKYGATLKLCYQKVVTEKDGIYFHFKKFILY